PPRTVTEEKPRFSWHLPKGAANVELKVFRKPNLTKPLASFTTSESSAVLPVDLRTGDYRWQAVALNAQRAPLGKPLTRDLTVELRMRVTGEYVEIDGPREAREHLERLAHIGDEAIKLYGELLGLPPPTTRYRAFLLATRAGYDEARAQVTGSDWVGVHNSGF